ncbi:hypothetical protein [Amycolatopsis sp. NPDC059657]|uniref:hypothetical protein n=1 Tax=Amycolatopsis sp. NPDC059657 TaxID=3346899 RepID=UPI00366E791D
MPIRTNRGRAAVYRRLWGFPLRSPKHLVGTLIVVAALLTTLGIVLPKVIDKPTPTLTAIQPSTTRTTSSHPGSGPGAPPPAGATTTTPPPQTRLSGSQTTPTPSAPNADAIRVAKEWANAWVRHPAGITQEQWLEGMRAYTTEEFFAAKLTTVPVESVGGNQVTGEPQVVNSFTSSLLVTVPTDGPKLSITLVVTNAGWRVSEYDKAS